MAKKRDGAKASGSPRRGRPKGAGRIKTRYSVVCTPEYKLWMEAFREFLGETEVSDVYRRAVRELAESRGFRVPPTL